MRVVGIDINPSGVRVVRLDKNFRDLAVAGVAERAFAQPSGPDLGEIEKALTSLKQEGALDGELWVTSLASEKGYLRILEIPHADAEKTNLLVRNELDGATPEPIDEHSIIASQILEGGNSKGKQSKVLAAMGTSSEVSSLLSRLSSAGLDPQLVTLDGAALGALAGRLAPTDATVLLDLGIQSSTLIVTQNGVPVLVRTIKRGLWPMAQRLSRAAELPPAEVMKRLDQLAIPEPLLTEMAQPFAVEIRRSVQGLRKNGITPQLFVLTGEGARMKSLDSELANLTGLITSAFSLEPLKFRSQVQKRGNVIGMSPLFTAGNERYARALALALTGLDKSKALNLRQGALAFRGDFSRVAGQLAQVAVVMLILLSLGGVTAYGRYRVLKAEEKQAVAALSKNLKETTGKELNELEAIDTFLTSSDKGGAKKPWPEKTAFDILLAVSQRVPKDIKVDINKIQIQAKKTTLQGEIDNAGDVDALTAALKDFECFKEMKPGSVKKITSRDGLQRHEFTLDIETTCP
jgi:Tfp pilus assembly PilM family ATPase